MKARTKMLAAKLLIILSVIVIGLGIILTVWGEKKIFHPIYDVKIIGQTEKDFISITSASSDEPKTDVQSSYISIKDNGMNEQYSQMESNAQTPTTKESNIILREHIQKKYNVVVKYAEETSNYSIGGMSTTPIIDDAVSEKALMSLTGALSLYPDGFFEEIKNEGYPLSFYLIKNYSTNNITGVTDSTNKSIIISIATDYDFVDTIHHEIYHYMEKYMLAKGASFASWSSLNPPGFSYGVIDGTYSYARTFSEDAFFVNNYAMSDQYEDRASTFEYMMKVSKASCLNYGKMVWLKARTMSEQIDYFFNTVTPEVTEYWERYVY